MVSSNGKFNTDMAPVAITETLASCTAGESREVVTVITPTDCEPNLGYLIATRGDELSVLYKGVAGEEEGWLYAQHLLGTNDHGWILCGHVDFYLAGTPGEVRTTEVETDCSYTDGSALDLLPDRKTSGPEPGPEPDTDSSPVVPLNEWLQPQISPRRVLPWHEGNLDDASEKRQPLPTVPLPPRRLCNAGEIDAAAAQRPPRGREAQIITFGVETLDKQLLERCWKWPGGGATIQFSDEELRAAINRSAPNAGTVDVLVDARCFPDPGALQFCKHTGHHHGIITRICQHRNFGRWLSSVRARLGAAAAAGAARGAAGPAAPLLMIAVHCRSGKHRSVAAALILQHVLRRDGWHCSDPKHLSATRWWSCCKGQCVECRNPPQELQSTLDKALLAWRAPGQPQQPGCCRM